jgi:hypothetical protein
VFLEIGGEFSERYIQLEYEWSVHEALFLNACNGGESGKLYK